ncbi:MAG TPA: hypothetical protein VNT56_08870 [Acidimicrobiales bacterium]|jgi:hypothetical protein|nr:hypothetical protein [Acidimicrobiales bacterium]
MPDSRPRRALRAYTPTALPSVGARVLAFVSIVVAGVCGGLIAYAVTDLQCGSGERGAGDGCTVLAGSAGVVGAVASALGVAVVAVLVLRAMAEWRRQMPGP